MHKYEILANAAELLTLLCVNLESSVQKYESKVLGIISSVANGITESELF